MDDVVSEKQDQDTENAADRGSTLARTTPPWLSDPKFREGLASVSPAFKVLGHGTSGTH
jgi:hypothetical protein